MGINCAGCGNLVSLDIVKGMCPACYARALRARNRIRLGFLVAAALIVSVPAPAQLNSAVEFISGQASVIDGDTIEIHGHRVRLWGIDAPESDQLCRGSDSLPYRCGQAAALALADWIDRRPVTCSPRATDRYRRVVAVCSAGGDDLARWLVGAGLALDWPQYSRGAYSADQTAAASKGSGMFAGSYIEPWAYRACIRSGGRPLACSDGD